MSHEKLEAAGRPERPFEFCTTTIDQYDHNVTRHLGAPSWGHIEGARYRALALVLEELVLVSAWGGNYLLNFGPTASGEMPPQAYRLFKELGDWISHSGVSVQGTYGGPGHGGANVPITEHGGDLLSPSPARLQRRCEIKASSEPKAIRLLRTGDQLRGEMGDGILRLAVPESARTDLPDAVE